MSPTGGELSGLPSDSCGAHVYGLLLKAVSYTTRDRLSRRHPDLRHTMIVATERKPRSDTRTKALKHQTTLSAAVEPPLVSDDARMAIFSRINPKEGPRCAQSSIGCCTILRKYLSVSTACTIAGRCVGRCTYKIAARELNLVQ